MPLKLWLYPRICYTSIQACTCTTGNFLYPGFYQTSLPVLFYSIITQAAVIFNPYQPHVGATGALFGAVGLLFVELVHFWSIIRRPWLELIKLLTIMAVFIFSGTLPYLNIFSILTGLLLGMLCALGLLPYISIKRHKALCRIIIVAVSIPLVITIFFVMFYVFYKVQLLENCKFCKFVNCYPYTENMCKLLD